MRNRAAAAWLGVLGIAGCCSSLLLAGCHSQSAAAPAVAPAASSMGSANGRKLRNGNGGGGMPDMNDYPAPSGVRTGVMAGGKK